MLELFQITNLIVAGLSGFAAYLTLKSYIKASFNKIDSLYWGASFFLTSFIFLMYFIGKLGPSPRYDIISILLHFVETYVWLLQLFIAIRLLQASRNRSNTSIRITRVASELVKVSALMVFVAFIVSEFNSFYSPYDTCFQLFDLNKGDTLVEGAHAIVAIVIAGLIPSIGFYKLVKLGFFLRAVGEALQALNTHYYYPPTLFLTFLERNFAILGLLSILLGVIATDQIIKKYDIRAAERRTEEGEFNQIKHIFEEGEKIK